MTSILYYILKDFMRLLLLAFMLLSFSSGFIAQKEIDSSQFEYFRCTQKLKNPSSFQFYKYGSVKPRNLREAFCVFLTVDEAFLDSFKTMPIEEATLFASKPYAPFMRFDWGEEAFLDLSNYYIYNFKLYAPKLQKLFAFTIFHHWMNYNSPNFQKIAKSLKRTNNDANKHWKKNFKHHNNENKKLRKKIKRANKKQPKGKAKPAEISDYW
jgi:hypothetical protein